MKDNYITAREATLLHDVTWIPIELFALPCKTDLTMSNTPFQQRFNVLIFYLIKENIFTKVKVNTFGHPLKLVLTNEFGFIVAPFFVVKTIALSSVHRLDGRQM